MTLLHLLPWGHVTVPEGHLTVILERVCCRHVVVEGAGYFAVPETPQLLPFSKDLTYPVSKVLD